MTKVILIVFVVILLANVQALLKGSKLGFNPGLQAPESNYQLIAQKYGASWVRLWEEEWAWQGSPTDYSLFNGRAAFAKQYGLKVLAVCVGTPGQYSGSTDSSSDKYPPLPQYYSLFAEYCAGFIRNGADAVEIWNEPNNDAFWKPSVTLTSHEIFAAMVIATYPVVKAINPNAIVVTGGVCPASDLYATDDWSVAHNALEYAQRLFTVSGFATSFDVFGLHPYVWGNNAHPDDGLYEWNVWAQIPAFAELIQANVPEGKPMWFTEFGAPSAQEATMSESQQLLDYQEYLADLDNYFINSPSIIGVVFIYELMDNPYYSSSTEGFFGILRSDGTEKPASSAVATWSKEVLPNSPTSVPTQRPATPAPTANPTLVPTSKATLSPTSKATLSPTSKATLAPTSKPAKTSPCGATVEAGTTNSLVDAGGNEWTITTGGQIAKNGVIVSVTANVVQLAFINNLLWQLNSYGYWWYSSQAGSNGWLPNGGTTSSPLGGCPALNQTKIYIGCFVDNAQRVLNGPSYTDASMTPDTCRHFCGAYGYSYAGLQWSSQCFCGNSYDTLGQAADSACNMACSGNNNNICGGGYRNSVYASDYIGCWNDGPLYIRDLPSSALVDPAMTVEMCQTNCRRNGWAYAGLQWGDQCFCGAVYGTWGQALPSDCNKPCAGDASEFSGNGSFNNIFSTVLVA